MTLVRVVLISPQMRHWNLCPSIWMYGDSSWKIRAGLLTKNPGLIIPDRAWILLDGVTNAAGAPTPGPTPDDDGLLIDAKATVPVGVSELPIVGNTFVHLIL